MDWFHTTQNLWRGKRLETRELRETDRSFGDERIERETDRSARRTESGHGW